MNYQQLQRRTLRLLEQGADHDKASRLVDLVIIILILLNIVAILLESIESIRLTHQAFFDYFELFSVAFFSLEYVLRLWSLGAKYSRPHGGPWRGRKEYSLSFEGIIDLVAVAPFYLQFLFPGADLRVLRIFRLIRVFKLSHYSTAIEDLFQAIVAEKRSFLAALYLLLIAVLLTSSLMYFAENETQPEKFSSIPAAMYWSIITLTTVGYGDVSPVTWVGQAIAVLTAFMGVSTVALLTGIVASAFANQMSRRRAVYEAQLRAALKDGLLSSSEKLSLDRLRSEFNLSEEQVAAIKLQIESELKISEPQEGPKK